ncbi:hypothetical protein DFJ58DRAFT_823247 [Suillus subalutaceus]|uniref:uncharacterized protein n=1 Tax=Suillus subalutaceus TaxID=48586 RepID=UPI001B875B91|nr:uncharacterized protein DFJ58DRAFT_823247 [Suillus subalutaceus]KAG1832327.1 hypothetical protein DFJ58DRAFT_823247 [Suillus subalutaceus]
MLRSLLIFPLTNSACIMSSRLHNINDTSLQRFPCNMLITITPALQDDLPWRCCAVFLSQMLNPLQNFIATIIRSNMSLILLDRVSYSTSLAVSFGSYLASCLGRR